MSFMSRWSDLNTWDSHPTQDTPQLLTAGLDFVIAAAASGLQPYTSGYLGLHRSEVASAGRGSACVVQIGTLEGGQLVAVKIDRESSKPLARKEQAHFESYLGRLALELRILSHRDVIQHANILKILGFGLEEDGGVPSCFLVEEYSDRGNLRDFLKSGVSLTIEERLRFCRDVADALRCLHSLEICHGDVKLENALAFEQREKPGWCIKLCDFSNAIVADGIDPERHVRPGLGTPLLRAPELSSGIAFNDSSFNITSAQKTDIFSYGLFVWEILKNGTTYFEEHWLTDRMEDYAHSHLEIREAFINGLSEDKLCDIGTAYLETLPDLLVEYLRGLQDLIQGTLRSKPWKRVPMSNLVRILDGMLHCGSKMEVSNTTKASQSSEEGDHVFALTRYMSLFDVITSAFNQGVLIDDFPTSFQSLVLSDIVRLYDVTDAMSSSRASAAMMASECYALGFGTDPDFDSMLSWLKNAAFAGSNRAGAWLDRLLVLQSSPNTFSPPTGKYGLCEKQLASVPTELYLHARIQQHEATRQTEALLQYEALLMDKAREKQIEQTIVELITFNQLQVDLLSLLHVAAWLGLTSVLLELIETTGNLNARSKLGRTPIFYACLGGHLSTLRVLVEHGGDVTQQDQFGITPLHLCTFFRQDDIQATVSLLLEYGAIISTCVDEALEWEEHDITLLGTPLQWAVRCRDMDLIKTFIQKGAKAEGLATAIDLFYWEIADFLLQEGVQIDAGPPQLTVSCIEKPYRHWIAHGQDHLSCIGQTFGVLEKHGYRFDRHFEELDDLSLLTTTIHSSSTTDDFEIIRQLMQRGQDIKFKDQSGLTALGAAITRAKHNETWTETLQLLLSYHDVLELDAVYINESCYLGFAVVSDSVIGARELLNRGVNVNHPSQDGFHHSPLQLCVLCDRSVEMMTLLLNNGASTAASDKELLLSPLETRLSGLQRSSNLIDILIERESSKMMIVRALHVALDHALGVPETARRDTLEAFRHLLSRSTVRPFVNITDQAGVTLLHRAAVSLNSYLVTLLLEAGADVETPSVSGERDLLPLQAALFNGKFYWEAYVSKSAMSLGNHDRRREAAFEVTSLLLAEHRSSHHASFEGIVPLHLASFMGALDLVKEISRSSRYQIEAKGLWPGQSKPLTPSDMVEVALERAQHRSITPWPDVESGIKVLSTTQKHKSVLDSESRYEGRAFKDLEEFHLEFTDSVGNPIVLTLSPQRIYENAVAIQRLLRSQTSPPTVVENTNAYPRDRLPLER